MTDLSGRIEGPLPTLETTDWSRPGLDATTPDPTSEGPDANGGSTAASVIRVRDLLKRYGKFVAVDHVDLDVPEGAIFGLIGPNGAGKSTTFSVIASLLKPTSGTVEVAGYDPTTQTREVRQAIGYMPDQIGVYGGLTADEYLRFFAASYKIPRSDWTDLVAGLLELVGMEGKADVDVDTMSRGMKQRMSLARALIHDPDILILDEPASGLDPRARVELRELMQQLASMGKTLLISSHILSELQAMCTDIAILEGGKVLAAGTPESIARTLGSAKVTVTFSSGETAEYPVADQAEQIALLRRLVTEDERDVVAFVPSGNGLEDLFMSITEGGVR